MTSAEAWLGAREPTPPSEVVSGLAVDRAGDFADPTRALADAALKRLAAARARPGPVRDSAYDLLAADALLTYACEAALDEPDPDSVLTELIRRSSAP